VTVRDHEVVACEGEWDVARAQEFGRRSTAALANCPAVLILDFRPATFVEATTVGAICALFCEAARRDVAVVVTCGAGAVQRVFDLVHLADIVPVAATIEEALHGVRTYGDVSDGGR
jgi:anti-anti-sigma factor